MMVGFDGHSPRVRQRRAKVMSYVLIGLAMMAGTALGLFAATFLWPR
jgi:hypothetical protein